MAPCICRGPVGTHHIIVGTLLMVSILILAWTTYHATEDGFQDAKGDANAKGGDANVANFNAFRGQWAEAAVKSGLINPVYFPTYQSIMVIPAPSPGISRSDFEAAIRNLAQMIKVWYVNAAYRGDLASLAAAIDASVPAYVEPPKGAGDFPVLPEKVPANSAEAGTISNVEHELNTFFKPLLAYYEKVIRTMAEAKVNPSSADPKGEVTAAMPQVEIEVTANAPVAPLLSISKQIKEIQEGDGSDFLKAAATLKVLPDKVDLYLSTLSFAITRAQDAYKYVSSIGRSGDGPSLPPVQGSTAGSLGVSGAIDNALFFADAGSNGALSTLKSKYAESPAETANMYYRVSQTRRRLLDDLQSKFTESMKVAKETFARLDALNTQATAAEPTVYANVADGRSLIS